VLVKFIIVSSYFSFDVIFFVLDIFLYKLLFFKEIILIILLFTMYLSITDTSIIGCFFVGSLKGMK